MKRHLLSTHIFRFTVVAQALLVYICFTDAFSGATLPAGLLICSLFLFIGWQYRHIFRFAENVLTTLAFGGLGMIIGRLLDSLSLPAHDMAVHSHHQAAGLPSILHHLSGFEFVLMALFCIIGCEAICSMDCFSSQRKQRIFCKSSGHLMMVVGMLLGGIIANQLSPHAPLIMYTGMWLGMGFGAWLGLSLARQIIRGNAGLRLVNDD